MLTYFTSESVCKGHPDKVCDIIADSILDAALIKNPRCHNAVEATIKDNIVFIYGETDTPVDYESIARDVIKEIGYEDEFEVILRVSEQSSEINEAVEKNTVNESGIESIGAGDQGIIFGYACNETKNFMPLSISLAHEIAYFLDNTGSSKLLPDGKTQVTVAYRDGKLSHIDTILVSKQHVADVTHPEIVGIVTGAIMDAIVSLDVSKYFTKDTRLIINPSGSFTIGGPKGDSGTTGRKIVVDTYGGHGRVGGGCFSSKDPTKVDRSAAYYARYVAKNIVACGLAERCEVQVAYGIGISQPISLYIDCFNTNFISMDNIYKWVDELFNFEPANIINELDLRRPIYKSTACYGHFGNPAYPWEALK